MSTIAELLVTTTATLMTRPEYRRIHNPEETSFSFLTRQDADGEAHAIVAAIYGEPCSAPRYESGERISPWLIGLIAKIPTFDPAWPQDTIDGWLGMMAGARRTLEERADVGRGGDTCRCGWPRSSHGAPR